MKTFKIFSLIAASVFFSATLSAQDIKTETIEVAGNCGMCKNNIEKAAKAAGATEANWDKDKKILTVSYAASAGSNTKIQQSVANAGYDTRDIRATDASYKKLHECCKYERAPEKMTTPVKDSSAVTAVKAGCCSKETGTADAKSSCTSEAATTGTAVAAGKADCCSKSN